MNRTFVVAWREFTATVMTKGFFIGVVMAPALMMGAIFVIPMLITGKAPQISGSVAVIDRSGGTLGPQITDEAILQSIRERVDREKKAVGQMAEKMSPGAGAMAAGALPPSDEPAITVERLSAEADVEAEKKSLAGGEGMQGGRLALVVVAPDAVVKPAGADAFGKYELFIRSKLDDRIVDGVRGAVNKVLIDTRIRANSFDPAVVIPMTRVGEVEVTTVTAGGQRKTNEVAQFLIPAGFMFLLWISAFTGGQYLLTTTIEEKSNRIMEVLLSAVSPMQLMVGKILGQMCVGLLILGMYALLGSGALISFALSDLISWSNIGYLVIFFFLAFFVIACLMAAVGSAVSDVHEAQSLIGPIMIILIIPMILWMPILRNPNSTLATTLSFVPMINPFVMVLRIAGATEPIPAWQIAGSIAVGLATVVVMSWAAAKIFRIGVLMYGKPPNFATLIKWVRMA